MKNNPLVSIIVPTYNRRDLLPTAITSLLEQSYTNLEILVINDAGANVSDIIDRYRDPRIKYFTNEKNLDLAGTRNVGLKNSTGDYICLLDDDDFYLPHAIEFRLHMMKKLNADVVYTRALQNIFEKQPDGYYKMVHRQLYWDCHFDRDLILIQNISPCCCPLFSRKAWEKAPYWFDETLTTSEDWDFWVHLSRNNDFYELSLVDCECMYRMNEPTQMTGTRLGYTTLLPKLYTRWRPMASREKQQWVVNAQNATLRERKINPDEYGL